ncbi:Rrf2 family transcriptional regulator [Algihabitans albus]|uniref:Rrf2 family transcriptional regulator n=1 Tax=Algihabitans albus TaxID=2164067 RepID=UPI000E5D6BCD|nr:Rrf2 family transcriptional regulator [Algihabitans albus]
MRLNVQTDYALRLLTFLAVAEETRATTADIADRFGISKTHLTKVANTLGHEGFVETVRGRAGGLRLAQPAGQIVIGKVVRRMEADFAIAECFQSGTGGEKSGCLIFPACRLRGVLQQALEAFMATLDAVTLHDLVTLNPDLKGLLSPEEA